MASPYLFKPNDIATTPTGRMVKVLDVMPCGERRVKFLDNDEVAEFRIVHLTMFHAARPMRWKGRSL